MEAAPRTLSTSSKEMLIQVKDVMIRLTNQKDAFQRANRSFRNGQINSLVERSSKKQEAKEWESVSREGTLDLDFKEKEKQSY